MTFEQLMQHAHDIKEKAADLAWREYSGKHATAGGGNVSREPFRQACAFVEPLFEPFSKMPDPAKYDPLIADLTAAMQKVMTQSTPITKLSQDVAFAGTHLDKITTDSGYLQDWTGEAAMKFKANFLDTFKTISGNQFTALSTMKGVLQAHQEMWSKARTDIDKIAETTIHALDNAWSCGKNQWTFEFSVLSAVGTVASAIITIATGGATAPIVAIGAAASLGSAGVAASNSGSGTTADSIITSMKQAVGDLTNHIHEVETQQMADKVQVLIGAVKGRKDLLASARPQLAGMGDRDLTGNNGMGRPG
ncbi:hypothetical protein ACIA8C_23985 [Nocardia sp. NPDC051321]|uniref:hypothetical protein n=1 Tax=Nocardia sp. NPDC051321 TaxID=3364323 RepID=UPI00379B28F4